MSDEGIQSYEPKAAGVAAIDQKHAEAIEALKQSTTFLLIAVVDGQGRVLGGGSARDALFMAGVAREAIDDIEDRLSEPT